MFNQAKYFQNPPDITKLNDFLFKNGEYQIPKAPDLKQFSQDQLIVFGHTHAMYTIPTIELIDFLKEEISKFESVVEIGAGCGVIGKALGIRCTDNFCQDRDDVKQAYSLARQPPVKYGKHVINRDANWVAKKWAPDLILGSWITHKYNGVDGNIHGPNEEEILKNCKRYIMLGNLNAHSTKPILTKYPPKILTDLPFYVTRSMAPEKNAIFIWEGFKE